MKKRIADKSIYNDATYFNKPKEYFKFIDQSIKQIKSENSEKRIDKIIDVGCANGALLHYLSKENLNTTFIGYEPELSLIELGKILAPNIEFNNYGLYDISNLKSEQKADVVIAAGVIGIFDDPEKFLMHMDKLCKNDGSILLFSPFNENDIDVILQYKPSKGNEWQTGHNLFSLTTIKLIAEKMGYKYSFSSFSMPFPIKKTNDPMRSWTENFRGRR